MTSTSVAIRAIAPKGGPRRGRVKGASPWVYLFATILVAVCIGPVLYVIIGGFRTNAQITTDPSGFPSPWVVSNYTSVLGSSEFWVAMGNSTISAGFTTLGTVALGVMASYVIARYDFVGRGAMYSLFAAGLMFPITVAITPLYLLVRNLGLVNSLAGIILPQIAFALPTTIIILVPFLRAIPKELEEAASIDGAGRLGF
ncbi:MAG: carbohydrate ABC transporter permease, partial [Microbacterium gubbeenense]